MSSSRRVISGFIRLGLVVLALFLVARYFTRGSSHRSSMRVQTNAAALDTLGPGDMRIFSTDSSVDLVLQGNKILAGLSPKTVNKVRQDLDASASKDTSGFAASISQIVKKSVAGAIGTHAVFALSDLRDVRYENDQIVFDWKDGSTKHELFGNTTVNGKQMSKTFPPADAQRFVDAVRARQNAPVATVPAPPVAPPAAR